MANGIVAHRGQSPIDGSPIVVIAIKGSDNSKTGDMIQWYAIRADIKPTIAAKVGADRSICGDCELRDGRCYVVLAHGPTQIYKAWKEDKYTDCVGNLDAIAEFCRGHENRFTAYGDSTIVPLAVMIAAERYAIGRTGYTHQWQNPENSEYAKFVMAFTTPDNTAQAKALGYRVFEVVGPGQKPTAGAMLCLNSVDGRQCKDCLLCDGTQNPKHRKDIYIFAHGAAGIMKAWNNN